MNTSIVAKQERSHVNRIGLAFFILLLTITVLQYAAVFIAAIFFPSATESNLFSWFLSVVPLYCVGLPIVLIILGRNHDRSEAKVSEKLRFSRWMLALVISFGLMFVGNIVGNLLMFIVSVFSGTQATNPVIDAVLTSNPIIMALVTVVIAPLGEEFLFRRLIIDRTRRYGELPALILSALMFGAFHLNFYQFFYAFLIGLVFGYIYLKTGRLRYSIALHAVINSFSGIAAPYILRTLTDISEKIPVDGTVPNIAEIIPLLICTLALFIYAFILLGCFIATIVLLIVLRKKFILCRGDGISSVLLSPTVILFLILSIAITVVQIIL